MFGVPEGLGDQVKFGMRRSLHQELVRKLCKNRELTTGDKPHHHRFLTLLKTQIKFEKELEI
jgi:hypothetical protein